MKTLSKLQQLSFIIRREFLAISTSYAVLLVLMGGIFVYGLLYNYMYAPNIVTDVPVAVVDNSHSELSRDFIRWLDATGLLRTGARILAGAGNHACGLCGDLRLPAERGGFRADPRHARALRLRPDGRP